MNASIENNNICKPKNISKISFNININIQIIKEFIKAIKYITINVTLTPH